MSRRQLAVIIGLMISVVFLVIAFRDLSIEQVIEPIQRADGVLLLAAAAWYFVALTMISWRWGFLLRSMTTVPLSRLVQYVSIGYMGNNIYPLRAGEILRLVLLMRRDRVPFVRGATTVAVERVFDGVVMLTFIVLGLLTLDLVSPQIQTIVTAATPLFAAALIVFFGLALRPDLLERLVGVIAGLLPKKLGDILRGLSGDIIAGLQGLRTPSQLIGAVFASYASWMLKATVYWIVAAAFGIEVGYMGMLMVVGVVNLAGLIPASPGQFGVHEFFAILVLTGLGVADGVATAYAFVVHIIIWLPVTVVGFILLIQQGLRPDVLTRVEALKQEAVTQ